MKRITITFEDDLYTYLQERAKLNRRQTSCELNTILNDLKNNKLIEATTTNAVQQLQDTGLGVTIKAKAQPPTLSLSKTPEEIEDEQLAAFQKLAKSILGQELDISDCVIFPDNTYFEFAQPPADGKFCRWPYTMPREKQIEYINEWKEILNNNK